LCKLECGNAQEHFHPRRPEEWIQDNYLNLSRFVQDKLDEHIEENE